MNTNTPRPNGPKRGITPGLPTNSGSFKAEERGAADVTLGEYDPFTEPLSRIDLMRAWEIEAELARDQTATAPPLSSFQMPDGAGGTWHVSIGDWDPAATEACGIIESGQYTALRFDADGSQTGDFSAASFTDLTGRREAAKETAEFLVRSQRARLAKAATGDAEPDDDEHDAECAEEIRHSGACKHGPAYPAHPAPGTAPSTLVHETCPDCGGHGWATEHGSAAGGGTLVSGQCMTCGGKGETELDQATAYPCTRCGAKGWEYSWGGIQIACPDCGGDGNRLGTPAGRDDVWVPGVGEFHRSRYPITPDEPQAIRFEADRPLTDAEMEQMAALLSRGYVIETSGQPLGAPVRDSDRSFIMDARTDIKPRFDEQTTLFSFEQDIHKILDGSSLTGGPKIPGGMGATAPEVTVYYDSVEEPSGY